MGFECNRYILGKPVSGFQPGTGGFAYWIRIIFLSFHDNSYSDYNVAAACIQVVPGTIWRTPQLTLCDVVPNFVVGWFLFATFSILVLARRAKCLTLNRDFLHYHEEYARNAPYPFILFVFFQV
jgi:hypothetical protein